MNLVQRFQNFRYHDNSGGCYKIFSYAVKLAGPINLFAPKHVLVQKLRKCITNRVIANFLLTFTHFCYHGHKTWSGRTLNDSEIGRPHTRSLLQNLKPILNSCGIIVYFVWKFANFYHCNRGWSDTNFTCLVKLADPENPIFGGTNEESWWYVIYRRS